MQSGRRPDGPRAAHRQPVATIGPFPGTTIADAVATPDERVIVVGSDGNDIVVARFDANGKLDPTFGVSGVTTLDFNSQTASASAVALSYDAKTIFGGIDHASSVTVQSDGAILVAGTSLNNGAAFARFLPNGSPDASFDDGKLLLPITGSDWVRALDVSEAGITAAICDQNGNAGLVVRLTTDGKPDASINGNGRLLFRFGGSDCPFGLASTEGRMAAVGYARKPHSTNGFDGLSEDFAVAMYASGVTAPPPTPTPPTTPPPSPGERKTYLPAVQR